MPDCDHREICRHGEESSNFKKLLGAIKDGIPSRPDVEGIDP